MIILLILLAVMAVVLMGCKGKPDPIPDPDPEPTPEDTWIAFYPFNYTIPIIDYNKSKWQLRDMLSDKWQMYENLLYNFMEDRKSYDDYAMAKILTHKEDGSYYFKWSSDLEVFEKEDYWATPDEFVVGKLGKGDCDDFAGLHCDYLYRLCHYYLAFWIEVYWKRKVNNIWKGYGHAITLYKRSQESNWRCFSNQTWLGMTNGFETMEEIIRKFCPDDDSHSLTKVVARNPLSGKLLFEVKGSDMV